MSGIILRPDICVVGASAGGLALARAAAAMGAPVALVEKDGMAGDRLNVGRLPANALIASGRAAQTMRVAGRYGIRAVEPRVDFSAVRAGIQGVISTIAPDQALAHLEALGVQVIQGVGRFVDRNTLEVGDRRIQARRFVLATGSSPSIPRLPGLETVRFLTDENVLESAVAPSRLVVVGGGSVGVTLAQAYRRLGAEVTILEADRMLSRWDPELATVVRDALAQEGILSREGARINRIEPRGDGVRVMIQHGSIEEPIDGSHLLIATGRSPNVEGLGLELANVAFDHDGVTVDKNLRATNRRVYAIGDVAGGAGSTQAAHYHAGQVLRAILFRLPSRANPVAIPRILGTSPEIAVAGLDERRARERHRNIRVLRSPYSGNDRARADREPAGHIKIIAGGNGRILGAGIVGTGAGELIGLWQLAIVNRMKIGDIAALVPPYPTLSDVSRRAAIAGLSRGLRSPWPGRIMRFLRRFG